MATRRMFINPTVVVLLCIIGQAIGASSGISAASSGQAFRRWVHGCHSMIPCPPPFCDNPVYGPGNCCGYCPEPTSSQDVTKAKEPETQEAGELGGIIENIADRSKRSAQLELFRRYFTTTTPRTTPYCPFPCTHQGTHFCFPLPCYINCVDAVKPPGACCYICQNGPNCSYRGHVIPEGKFIIGPSGEEIHCVTGSYDGGSVEIRHRTTTSARSN